MTPIEKAINDATLHKNEAEREIRTWQIRLEERFRQLATLEILNSK